MHGGGSQPQRSGLLLGERWTTAAGHTATPVSSLAGIRLQPQERGARRSAQGPGVGTGWVPEHHLDEHPKPSAVAFSC